MKTLKPASITVGTFVPAPLHELLIEATCAVYEISRDELFESKRTEEAAQRRAMLFYLLKFDLDYSDSDIGSLVSYSRQRVSVAIQQVEFQIRNYLRVSCVCKNIRAVYSNLRKEQELWLNQHLQSNSITRLMPQSHKAR